MPPVFKLVPFSVGFSGLGKDADHVWRCCKLVPENYLGCRVTLAVRRSAANQPAGHHLPAATQPSPPPPLDVERSTLAVRRSAANQPAGHHLPAATQSSPPPPLDVGNVRRWLLRSFDVLPQINLPATISLPPLNPRRLLPWTLDVRRWLFDVLSQINLPVAISLPPRNPRRLLPWTLNVRRWLFDVLPQINLPATISLPPLNPRCQFHARSRPGLVERRVQQERAARPPPAPVGAGDDDYASSSRMG